ncbi:hypothetical protein [Streptomyces sp. NPDC056628]|uniref:hypothetical protein n=1 Tax=Streptomyces sp. NPDC056628 TaxID=3345882 RepID=UPI00369775CE
MAEGESCHGGSGQDGGRRGGDGEQTARQVQAGDHLRGAGHRYGVRIAGPEAGRTLGDEVVHYCHRQLEAVV